MDHAKKKLTNLLNELGIYSFNRQDSSDSYLHDDGYDHDELARTIAGNVRQTIARMKNESSGRSE